MTLFFMLFVVEVNRLEELNTFIRMSVNRVFVEGAVINRFLKLLLEVFVCLIWLLLFRVRLRDFLFNENLPLEADFLKIFFVFIAFLYLNFKLFCRIYSNDFWRDLTSLLCLGVLYCFYFIRSFGGVFGIYFIGLVLSLLEVRRSSIWLLRLLLSSVRLSSWSSGFRVVRVFFDFCCFCFGKGCGRDSSAIVSEEKMTPWMRRKLRYSNIWV